MEFPSSGADSIKSLSDEVTCIIEDAHPENQDIGVIEVHLYNTSENSQTIQETRSFPPTDETVPMTEERGIKVYQNVLPEIKRHTCRNKGTKEKSVNKTELPALLTPSTEAGYSSKNPTFQIPTSDKGFSSKRFNQESPTILVTEKAYLVKEKENIATLKKSLDDARDNLAKYSIQLDEHSKIINSFENRNKILELKKAHVGVSIQTFLAVLKATEASQATPTSDSELDTELEEVSYSVSSGTFQPLTTNSFENQQQQQENAKVTSPVKNICNHCKKRGHIKSDCWVLHGKPQVKSPQ